MNDYINLDDELTFSTLEHIANGLPGGFFIYHADGDENFIYVNNAMLRIFGCDTLEEFRKHTKNSFRHMVHPDDIDKVEKNIADQIKRSNQNLDYVEYRIIRRDGAIRWITDYGHFIHSKHYGDIFYVFIDDATEKRMLMSEEGRKQSVIEGLSHGFNSIYLINTEANTIIPYAWNDPISKEIVEQIFQNSLTETDFSLFNENFVNSYIFDEDKEKFNEIINLANIKAKVDNGIDILHVFRSIIHDGAEQEYVQLSISPVKGSSILAVMAMKTVTKQMQRIKAETLEKLLIEQERDNAIHASNAKSAFLFNMSHDLKTPINAIAGFAELARKNVGGDKVRIADYLEKIKISSDMLVELINDVLSMTEIESGHLNIQEGPCDLINQIATLSDIFKPQISNKNQKFTVNIDIKHNQVIADSLNLKRICSNLLQNAVSYTNDGGKISFTVSEDASANSDGSINYTFTVIDTGCGITKNFMSRMYNAFEREQNTTQSHVAGTGLGLTITKNLVEAMHGKISAESEVGKGSTFTVVIPLKISEKYSEVDVTLSHIKSYNYKTNNKQKRVLLVEDNELNREIALEIIWEAGYQVVSAIDGIEAVNIFSTNSEMYFDAIFMDIQMPRMNGYEATKAIRALPRADAKAIPIFALTANTLERDRQLAIDSGMNDMIPKPIEINKFIALLQDL